MECIFFVIYHCIQEELEEGGGGENRISLLCEQIIDKMKEFYQMKDKESKKGGNKMETTGTSLMMMNTSLGGAGGGVGKSDAGGIGSSSDGNTNTTSGGVSGVVGAGISSVISGIINITDQYNNIYEILNEQSMITILVDISILLSYFKLNEIFQMCILDMIGIEKLYEQQLISMYLFNSIADNLHITFDKTYFKARRKKNIIDYIPSKRIFILLNYRDKFLKSELPNELLSKFRYSLEQLVRYSNKEIGNELNIKNNKKLSSNTNKIPTSSLNELKNREMQRMYLIHLLRVEITCMSRIPPSNMPTLELINLLISKCFHVDKNIAKESKNLLISLLRTRPSMRVSITEEMAKYLLQFLFDYNLEVLIRFGLHILYEFFKHWNDPYVLHTLEPDTNYIDIDIRNRKIFSASLFEAVSLVLLTSTSIGIRSDAVKLLYSIEKLNSQLPFHIAEPGIRLYSIIQHYDYKLKYLSSSSSSNPYLHQFLVHDSVHYFSSSTAAPSPSSQTPSPSSPAPSPSSSSSATSSASSGSDEDKRSFLYVALHCSDDDQIQWSKALGSFIHNIRLHSHRAISICFCLLIDRIKYLTPLFLPPFCKKAQNQKTKELDPPTLNRYLILWRNSVLLACSIGDGDISTFAATSGLLSGIFFFSLFLSFSSLSSSSSSPLFPLFLLFLLSFLFPPPLSSLSPSSPSSLPLPISFSFFTFLLFPHLTISPLLHSSFSSFIHPFAPPSSLFPPFLLPIFFPFFFFHFFCLSPIGRPPIPSFLLLS